MNRKSVGLPFLAIVGALAMTVPSYAAANRQESDPNFLQVKIGQEWHGVSETLVSKASPGSPGQVLPFLIFDEQGQLSLRQLPVEGSGWAELFKEGSCNGGSCASGGSSLNCPTSGGPTCGSDESCYCVCEGGGGTSSTHNECRKRSGGGEDDPPLEE